MGLNLLLDISRQSFRALDAAMNVASQNVANAETEGYHRRRVELTAIEMSPRGILGSGTIGPSAGGVQVSSYQRMRDAMLDHARWEARGGLNYANEQERIMSTVESLFPSGPSSLSQTVEQFFNGWADLSDHPTDNSVRLALLGRAETLAARMHTLDTGLDRMATETKFALNDRVDEANLLIDRVAQLNVTVAHARRSGNPDMGSEDALGVSLERLSELVPARFEAQDDGSTSVYIGGMRVVQLAETVPLTLDNTGTTPVLTFGDTNVNFPTGTDSGIIGALLGPSLSGVADARDKLNALAESIVTEVNALHSAGYGTDGGTGRDFFDPTGVSAGTIAVSSDVSGSPTAIAASSSADATGDNTNALDIHDLRFSQVMGSGTQTITDYAVDIATSVGSSVAAARARSVGAESTVAGLDALAKGVSSVSIDEEMVSLIQLQQAYAASARLLSVAEDMFSTLLAI
ncbi:MAG: flagellar hook-associated protein FlgK [Rhodothermales bacterium]|nr:flagellar hook-associated protein FlgK [Rhodothermales bacterium]